MFCTVCSYFLRVVAWFVCKYILLPALYLHNLCKYQTGDLEANRFNDSKTVVVGRERGKKAQQIKIDLSCIENQEKSTRELLV